MTDAGSASRERHVSISACSRDAQAQGTTPKIAFAALFSVALLASPADAQLSPDAFTWGAEVHSDGRSTVISARKQGSGWTVVMECTAPGKGGRERVLRYRGKAEWSGAMMLGILDRGMRIVVVPREDGVGVVTSGMDCAQGPGLLTSGGG